MSGQGAQYTAHSRSRAIDAETTVDPISFEVIRHKLQAIVAEQAITLKAVSGSPVVTEATDFNCGLYLDDGSIAVMGPQVIFHAGTMSSVIRSIMRDSQANPGIRQGDMFILNDPYRGAIHQPDISIVAPIFYEGRHIAWAGSCAHQLDTGGMSFGSWAYRATEVQQEAMLLPGIKLVEGGVVREDLWRMILGMSRLPEVIGLDLKAMIAANHVASQRFSGLLDRYGAETVIQVMNAELDASERQLRERLLQLPDGTYRARDYLEHDGHSNRLYEVCLAVEKVGDTLTFDLANTSPQAPGFINCTASGLKGALFAGLLPILAPDIRWNEGLLRVVSIRVPESSLCNATWPAPVSGATVSSAWVVCNAAVAALSRMVGISARWAKEGQAVTKGHMMVMTLAGRDRAGAPYGNFLMDALAGGGGAFIDHDGLDGSGDYVVPRPAISNVEATEAHGPLLYLFRGFVQDTAGAGRSRGGVTAGVAITPHDTEDLQAMLVGHGVEVPNSVGLFGGLPGACGYNLFVSEPRDIERLLGQIHDPAGLLVQAQHMGAKPGLIPVRAGQVIGYTFQGGGGYGDPLERDPAFVARDVCEGFVSLQWASELYGVVMRGDEVDAVETSLRRTQIRRERLGGRTPSVEPAADATSDRPGIRLGAERGLECRCGNQLAAPGGNWKDSCHARDVNPKERGPHIRLHADLMMREYYCPSCAALLEVEVLRKDESPLATIVIAA
jgi:N-methylhydantoinase B